MRVLTWNIRHGGGRRLPGIIGALRHHDPDVLVLTEYRVGLGLEAALAEAGWRHQIGTNPPARANGVLVAAHHVLELVPPGPEAPQLQERFVEVRLPGVGLRLTAVHIPTQGDRRGKPDSERWDKRSFWLALLAVARGRIDDAHVIIGDYNTGSNTHDAQGMPFTCSEQLAELEAMGWVDAWCRRHPDEPDFTWFSSKGNGFRVDHGHLSPDLAARLVGAFHSHHEREQGLSDHASLTVDLDI